MSEVVEAGQVEIAADKIVDQLAKGPRVAQGVIRGLVASAYDNSENTQLDLERDAMARAQVGDEASEGISAFLEKRKAEFK